MKSTAESQVDIGIDAGKRKQIAGGLSRVLADTYLLYLKTHNYHWNVTGTLFNSLHLMFETQYTALAVAIDLIAERIRALGFPAPGSFASYSKVTSIKEEEGVPEAREMVANLVTAHETVARVAREVLKEAEEAGDQVSVDLLTQRMQEHEKTAWMLRSINE